MTTPYGEIVSRARLKPDASSAGRIATSRRAVRDGDRSPARERKPASTGKKSAGKKGGKAKPASSVARLFKLIMLVTFMAMLGFGVVLVVDVGLTMIGGVHLGSITFAELVEKVEARVFDRDLPEPNKKKPAAAVTAKQKAKRSPVSTSSSSSSPIAETERAELPAPAPNDYAKAVEPRTDVEVVEARARLDRLLKGL